MDAVARGGVGHLAALLERNDQMNLNLSNITSRFSQISGVYGDDLSSCREFISHGKYLLEKLIVVNPCDEEIPICEYCAACCGYYSFVCAMVAKPKHQVTANGIYSTAKADSSLVASAKLLKEQALMSISHLTEDFNFVFTGVGE